LGNRSLFVFIAVYGIFICSIIFTATCSILISILSFGLILFCQYYVLFVAL
jgi:hypothetical protein